MPASPHVLSDLVLEGEHLRLRPLRSDDADPAFPLVFRERRVLDWLCWQGPGDLDELREDYARWRVVTPAGANYRFAVLARADEEFLGTVSLRFVDHPHVGDLGYWLGVPFHGRGYGRELVGLMVHLGFEVLRSAALSAEVFPGNDASAAILRRNGFRLERPAPALAAPADAARPPDPSRPRDLYLCMATDRPKDAKAPTLVRATF
ncbi:MAG: GNAT family N-acetyltransferase [Planctomycetota bacterium]